MPKKKIASRKKVWSDQPTEVSETANIFTGEQKPDMRLRRLGKASNTAKAN